MSPKSMEDKFNEILNEVESFDLNSVMDFAMIEKINRLYKHDMDSGEDRYGGVSKSLSMASVGVILEVPLVIAEAIRDIAQNAHITSKRLGSGGNGERLVSEIESDIYTTYLKRGFGEMFDKAQTALASKIAKTLNGEDSPI